MAKGFNRPAGGGGQAGMMQQLQRLQQQMAETQEQLALESVSATAGGGAVKVTMSGDQKCQAVEISADLLKDADVEMLQAADEWVAILRMPVPKSITCHVFEFHGYEPKLACCEVSCNQ